MINSNVSLLVRKSAAIRPESPGWYDAGEIMARRSKSLEMSLGLWLSDRLTDLHDRPVGAARGIEQDTLAFVNA
jgi:hypothetical protein